ncbi:MAG TPA: triose-phosphate isomerase [Hadesarchaea archaeon]|nr:triose-phosphate isomerase [Hadesarchaea archaeon]
MLKTPIVVVNFKTYQEATSESAVRLAELIAEVSGQSDVESAVAPQTVDLATIAEKVKIPVFAQHVDPIKPGRNTGFISPESAKTGGAVGTLVNHSEHKLPRDRVKAVIERTKEVGLYTIACTADMEESRKIAEFSPDMIAVEPPELIGSGIPVSKAKPEVVKDSVKVVKKVNPGIKVLCGAGITSGEDVTKALGLGAEGVLIASGVVKAKDQRAAFQDIVNGVLKFRG